MRHRYEAPAPTTRENAVAVDSAPGAAKNSGTLEPMSEEVPEPDPLPVDDAKQNDDVAQTGASWQNEAVHVLKSTRSPFAKKITRIEDMDPDDVADMMIVGLIKRFGDIPEVHTFIALRRKRSKNEPLTLDEHIDFTAAQYHLFPHPETKKTLEIFLEKRAAEYPRSSRIVR